MADSPPALVDAGSRTAEHLSGVSQSDAAALALLRGVIGEEEAEKQSTGNLLRFLRAASWKVSGTRGAAARVIANNRWRESVLPVGRDPSGVSLAAVEEAIRRGKMQLLEQRDAEGHPVLLLNFREIVSDRQEVVLLVVTYVHLLERAIAELPPGGPASMVTLVNVWGCRRPPSALLQRIAAVKDAHYPGRTHKVLIYPVPQHLIAGVEASMGGAVPSLKRYRRYVDTPQLLERELGIAFDSLPAAVRDASAEAAASACTPWLADSRMATAEPVVQAPWYPEGVLQNSLTLEEELADFSRFYHLQASEEVRRAALVGTLQTLVRCCLPDASLKPCGSHALGCLTARTVVDLIAEGCADMSCASNSRPLADLQDVLRREGLAVSGTDTSAQGSTVSVFAPDGTAVRLNFDTRLPSPCRKLAVRFRAWIEEMPELKIVFCVLQYVLASSRLLDSRDPALGAAGGVEGAGGGLTPSALFGMIVFASRLCRNAAPVNTTASAETVLFRVLSFFGSDFDAAAESIDLSTLDRVPKVHVSDQLSIVDPVSGTNLAATLSKLPQLLLQLRYYRGALANWEKHNGGSGYRGRTPLSCLISYGPLWSRCQDLVAASAAPVPP